MRIALIAHDSRKELMAQFCTAYLRILSENELVATGVTGKIVHDATGLPVRCLYPGGRGGSEKRCAVRCLGGEVLQPLFQHELRLGDILRIIDVNDVKAAGIDVETVVAVGARRRFRVPDAHLREHRFRLEPGGFSQPFVMMGRINEQAAQHPLICTVGGEKENDAADKLLIQRQRISVCA